MSPVPPEWEGAKAEAQAGVDRGLTELNSQATVQAAPSQDDRGFEHIVI